MTAMRDELRMAGVPTDGLGQTIIVARTIRAIGSEEQKQRFLPPALAGEIIFALGYTEPDSGSDVAAAKTRAIRDGDDWIIDGQKMFTTLAHEAAYVLLLTRTNPDVPKHRGPDDVPGAARRTRGGDPPGAHHGRRAHQRHLLLGGAGARLAARRRRRRRLGRHDGRAHVRARRVRAQRGRPGVAADRRLGDRDPSTRRHPRHRRSARARTPRHHARPRRGRAPARRCAARTSRPRAPCRASKDRCTSSSTPSR